MIEIAELSPAEVSARAGELADVLDDVVAGGASLGFLSPLRREDALAYWRGRAAPVADGAAVLWVACVDGRVVGTVQLHLAAMPNGRHRAEIAKLMVRRDARGRGVAGALLGAAERGAVGRGVTLLVLDTQTGSPAERLYRSSGWTEVGVIPDFATDPGGVLQPTTVFYKLLPRESNPRNP
ncbi:GNAT superfamily N-acetyltransferase [Saccharothrix coeruleofusca]|uniref:GNAT family N-acetyltransferase n=1 Tax=Saccharothrix coeruleofusca TaxID=33919 RepID=UPI001AE894CB|nr:GNAT family N-acetyltransferase [Saccharothrix coeruleofusca]MBP2338752.1 GNAT superfamily N-acetyltransferase [Saccharothrix coeruleofusca]